MQRRSRSGSTIAEASVVLPLVILAVLTCVLYCVFCYSLTVQQCRMHAEIRKEASQLTGRSEQIRTGLTWEGSISTKRQGLFQSISGEEMITMKKQGIMSRHISEEIQGVWQASDGVAFVRYYSLAKNFTEER